MGKLLCIRMPKSWSLYHKITWFLDLNHFTIFRKYRCFREIMFFRRQVKECWVINRAGSDERSTSSSVGVSILFHLTTETDLFSETMRSFWITRRLLTKNHLILEVTYFVKTVRMQHNFTPYGHFKAYQMPNHVWPLSVNTVTSPTPSVLTLSHF
jgi:hypothetical protein